jgi:hypothetical protein
MSDCRFSQKRLATFLATFKRDGDSRVKGKRKHFYEEIVNSFNKIIKNNKIINFFQKSIQNIRNKTDFV